MTKEELIIIGEALKEIRKSRELTLDHVAEHLGVTHKSVQFWEQGRNEIKLSTFVELCKLYEVSPDAILDKVI